MDNLSINLTAISPFVRYVRSFTIEPGTPFTDVVPYDYRLLYIVEGKGRMKIGGNLYHAFKGCLFLWRPGVQYSYLPDEAHPFFIYAVNFDFTSRHACAVSPISPDRAELFDPENITETVNFTDFPLFNAMVRLEDMAYVEHTLLEMISEYMTRKIFCVQKLQGIFTALIYEIARIASVGALSHKTGGFTADEMIDYLQQHYSEEITNETLGKRFNFHPAYISRLMQRHTGMPLHRYLIRYRVLVAVNLLQSTGCSVGEAATKVGFTDVNYFSRCFKKYTGTRPSHYISGG